MDKVIVEISQVFGALNALIIKSQPQFLIARFLKVYFKRLSFLSLISDLKTSYSPWWTIVLCQLNDFFASVL
jgi:hypothetical protein